MEGKKSSVNIYNTCVTSKTHHGRSPHMWPKRNQRCKPFSHKPKFFNQKEKFNSQTVPVVISSYLRKRENHPIP